MADLVKFKKLSQSAYTALKEKDDSTLYFVESGTTLSADGSSRTVTEYSLYLGAAPVVAGT